MKNFLICVALGLAGWLSYLGFAPFHKFYFVIFAICIFLLAIKSSESKKTLLMRANIFGFFWFFGQLSWIGESFKIVQLDNYGLPSLIMFCVCLSMYMWIPALTAYSYRKKPILLWLSFSIGWSISEVLRSYLFTGFPWNLIGQVWQLPILQLTAYTGIFGLSLLTIILFASIICANRIVIILLWLAFAVQWYLGIKELSDDKIEYSNIYMRLIQPSIEQKQKWQRDLFSDHMTKQVQLSANISKLKLSAIIWPEAGIPEFLKTDDIVIKILAKEILQNHDQKCIWITGVPTLVNNGLYNSLLVTDQNNTFIGLYHKVHLVPFGEFIPLRSYLPINKMTHGTLDYTKGDNNHLLTINSLPTFAVLICYEAIFPDVFDSESKRPKWILNVTNDGWFGNTIGPHQHLQMATTRAIEQGLPLVRAANDGISAVIDHKGRILHKLDKNVVGYIDFNLPRPGKPTLLGIIGAKTIYLLLILCLVIIFWLLSKMSAYRDTIH